MGPQEGAFRVEVVRLVGGLLLVGARVNVGPAPKGWARSAGAAAGLLTAAVSVRLEGHGFDQPMEGS